MKCAVLLRVFSLPSQSKAFRKDTVFFLLPPFSTGCAKMVGFPYAHKSRAFELKHGAVSRNTLSGLLGLSICRLGKRTKSGPRSFLSTVTIKAELTSFISVCFGWIAPTAASLFDGFRCVK